jgi:hypothetical protein
LILSFINVLEYLPILYLIATSFASRFIEFSKLAEDVASSRFWGGVHWKQDNEQGLLGKKIGLYIINEKLDLNSYKKY